MRHSGIKHASVLHPSPLPPPPSTILHPPTAPLPPLYPPLPPCAALSYVQALCGRMGEDSPPSPLLFNMLRPNTFSALLAYLLVSALPYVLYSPSFTLLRLNYHPRKDQAVSSARHSGSACTLLACLSPSTNTVLYVTGAPVGASSATPPGRADIFPLACSHQAAETLVPDLPFEDELILSRNLEGYCWCEIGEHCQNDPE